jgi:hypothetical protein
MEVKKVTKTFVEFQYPGLLFAESGDPHEVSSRNIEDISIPENATGFKFFDRNEAVIDGQVLKGEIENESGWFYIGQEFAEKDIEAINTNGEYNILLDNLRFNDYKTVVKTRFGNWYPVWDKDQVVGSTIAKGGQI